jgi:putative endonuclease
MFYLYVLKCRDGSLYTGYTNDLEKRIEMHQKGKASKYTRSRLPVRLIYSHSYSSKSEAMRAEAAFKKLPRKEKMALIGS